MKTIVAVLLGLALADPSKPPHQQSGDQYDVKVHYRRFNRDMVGAKANGARWFESADPNMASGDSFGDRKYTGPHNSDWKMANSKNSYYSYDLEDGETHKDGGMQSHDHIRTDTAVPDNSSWDAARSDSDAEASLWESYMKKEKFFSMQEGGYKSANIKGGDASMRLENLDEHAGTYMQEKDHLQFFTAESVCNPKPVREAASKERAADMNHNLIEGLRARHDSGHTYQGCSLDNCAVTVMYACSFMCTSCQAKWCRDECQAQKERAGSCFKVWEDIQSVKCKAAGLEKKQSDDSDNIVLNPEAALKE